MKSFPRCLSSPLWSLRPHSPKWAWSITNCRRIARSHRGSLFQQWERCIFVGEVPKPNSHTSRRGYRRKTAWTIQSFQHSARTPLVFCDRSRSNSSVPLASVSVLYFRHNSIGCSAENAQPKLSRSTSQRDNAPKTNHETSGAFSCRSTALHGSSANRPTVRSPRDLRVVPGQRCYIGALYLAKLFHSRRTQRTLPLRVTPSPVPLSNTWPPGHRSRSKTSLPKCPSPRNCSHPDRIRARSLDIRDAVFECGRLFRVAERGSF